MATREENTNDQSTVLGDINPEPGHSTLPTWPGRNAEKSDRSERSERSEEEEDRSASSASTQDPHDRTRHPGSRDVTEGTTGGTGTDVGGTRNLRTGTGATGTDLGGRPE